MFGKILSILEYSRYFSLPMTILSWLIIFVYSLTDSGNVWYGFVSLIGICFVHLGTNLLDDFFDYKYLMKKLDFDKGAYLENTQKTKCRYIISGLISEKQILKIITLFFAIGVLCGLYLYTKCGIGIVQFASAGALIALIYPLASRICLSEILIALAYGPLLFGGVYYAMTGAYSNEVFILSIPSMIITVVLLYIHTVMDYEFDLNEGHNTIANRFDSQLDSLIVLKILLISAYLSVIFLCIPDIVDWQVFLTFITIPLAIDLYKSLFMFSENPEAVPERKWYHFPMENWNKLEKQNEISFMMRMYQSRNLMIYFSLFMTLGIIFSLLI